ncbi:MAG: exopolyphosphatase, partial [Betaproteobacteria bacterium]|nr:exopolyphosphatase [Betaproteobacteria bacterium]
QSGPAIADILHNLGDTNHGITRAGMDRIRSQLIKDGVVNSEALPGLKADRIPVFAGGLAIMIAVFEELSIEHMQFSDGALRLGVLYDVLGRGRKDDMRYYTVEQFVERYSVDRAQAERVANLAARFWDQVSLGSVEERGEMETLIRWAATLLEVGHSISHNSFHKHSAYIVSQADMPGFSRRDQRMMANLVLGHVGKLGKVATLISDEAEWSALMCLRLAAIFYRNRLNETLPEVKLVLKGRVFRVAIDGSWLKRHPLTQHSLEQEKSEWRKVGIELEVV